MNKNCFILLLPLTIYASDSCRDNLVAIKTHKIACQLLFEEGKEETPNELLLDKVRKLYVLSNSMSAKIESQRLEEAYEKRLGK